MLLNRVYGSNFSVIDHQAITGALSYDIFIDAPSPLNPGVVDIYNLRLATGAMELASFNQGSRK